MAKKCVVNASPLIVLARINKIFSLRDLAEEIVVPAGVAKEIAHGPEDDPAKEWLQSNGRNCRFRPKSIILFRRIEDNYNSGGDVWRS
jgi:predicted nucleic acid-binding protein